MVIAHVIMFFPTAATIKLDGVRPEPSDDTANLFKQVLLLLTVIILLGKSALEPGLETEGRKLGKDFDGASFPPYNPLFILFKTPHTIWRNTFSSLPKIS